MTVSTRIRGNSGKVVKIKLGAAAAVDYSGDCKAVTLDPEDKDDNDLTFEEANSGDNKDWFLNLTAIQSTDAASLWRFLWANPGAEFTVTYGPHGNAVPTAAKPHFEFTGQANGKPKIGGEARRSNEGDDFEYQIKALTTPVEKTS